MTKQTTLSTDISARAAASRNARPLVSVLTPSFCQGRFLSDCIASVTNQTYDEVEHVICDGGSTDETLDVLRAAPPHVQWVSEADRGQAHAINKAFERSRGEIVGWLNSDDAYYDRRAVAEAVAIFVRRPDVDVVYGHAALVGADNEVLHFMWAPKFRDKLFAYANFVVQPTVFLRRSALGSRIVDERLDFAVDLELWLRLRAEGRRFARQDRIAAIDRHHGTRKVYTMEEIGRREIDELYAVYGGSSRVWKRALPPAFRAIARLRGLGLLSGAREQLALDLHVPRTSTALRRQILMRRRSMPLLDEAGQPG